MRSRDKPFRLRFFAVALCLLSSLTLISLAYLRPALRPALWRYAAMAAPSTQGALAAWLTTTKEAFLTDLKEGKDLRDWVLVTGNEAGDIDSLASAVAFAYLATKYDFNPGRRHLSLVQTNFDDLRLRKENERIVEDADVPKVSLLWLNEVDLPRAVDQGVRIALVDHNHATFRFGHASVTAVIDHHADEHLYKDAVPRVVTQGIGSCSSLVTTHYSNFWTDEQDDHSPTSSSLRSSLANLLSGSILIDTVNLKRVPGKASDTDYAAYRLLLPHLSHPSLQSYTIASETEQSQPPTERFDLLFTLKSDVTSLTSRDLLRRDYKSFTTESNHRKAGLSTVVRSLTDQGGNQWPVALAAWAEEEDLDVAMILTSFETTKKHKRRKEIAALIPRARENVEVVRAIFERFPEAFVEKSPLEPWTEEEMASLSGVPEGCEVRVWKQIETTPTRKQVAPAIVSVLGEVPARSSQ